MDNLHMHTTDYTFGELRHAFGDLIESVKRAGPMTHDVLVSVKNVDVYDVANATRGRVLVYDTGEPGEIVIIKDGIVYAADVATLWDLSGLLIEGISLI